MMHITKVQLNIDSIILSTITEEQEIYMGELYRLEFEGSSYDFEVTRIEAYYNKYKNDIQPQEATIFFKEVGDARFRLFKKIVDEKVNVRTLINYDIYKIA